MMDSSAYEQDENQTNISQDEQNLGARRPTTRAARLSLIEEAILTDVITSQAQLAQMLSRYGIDVTQATLSRDLDEINAVKIRLADGRIAYVLGDGSGNKHAIDTVRIEQQVSRILSGLVTEVSYANNLVVVHTPSGAAQYVASVIDRQPLQGVLGTIAGDDTVLIICSDDDEAGKRADWLLNVASK